MKKLLPLLSLCSATAIVAPIVTSCSHDINVNMEWYKQAPLAIGYYKAEQSIVQKQLYKIHIDLSVAEWELDYAATSFRFSYAAKSKD